MVLLCYCIVLCCYIMSLEDEIQNNGDKFYRRKSMRAADEKLIINELGTNYAAISLAS